MSRKGCILAGLGILVLYFLPNLILGEHSVIQVHDFLDSNVAHIQSMKLSGSLWDMDATLPILGGVERAAAGTPYSLRVVLFWLLPTFWAILANLLLIKLTAFLGMFRLLSAHLHLDLKAAFAAAILFALVPFYPDYGISSAGIPLLALAFLNLKEKRRIGESLCLILYYAFFSSLLLSGVFACVLLALLILWDWIQEKQFPLAPFAGLAFLTLLYVAFNWDLFAAFLSPEAGEVSHRVEFAPPSLWESLGVSLGALLVAQYHAGTCLAVLPLAVFAIKYRKQYPSLWGLTLLVLGLMLTGAVAKEFFLRFRLMDGFQTDRFYFLYPALAFTLLGVVLQERPRGRGYLVAGMLVFSLAFDAHWRDNLATKAGIVEGPDFDQYYDTQLFDSIREDLPLEGAAVACVGMHPAIPEYNGIPTVDGYYPSYPLSYKHRFQQVIQAELDKSADLKAYFCDWGSRCYIFSSELGTKYLWSKKCGVSIHDLSIDVAALKALGCTYLFSAVPIENAAALGLEPCGSWTREDAFWQICVYRL